MLFPLVHLPTDLEYIYRSVDHRLANEAISGDPTAQNNGSVGYGLDPVGNQLSIRRR